MIVGWLDENHWNWDRGALRWYQSSVGCEEWVNRVNLGEEQGGLLGG